MLRSAEPHWKSESSRGAGEGSLCILMFTKFLCEAVALLGCYAAQVCSWLPTPRVNLSIPCSMVRQSGMGPMVVPKRLQLTFNLHRVTSQNNKRPQLYCDGVLKSRKLLGSLATPSASRALIPHDWMKFEDRRICSVGKESKGGCCDFDWKFCFCICLMKLEELRGNRCRSRGLNLAHFEYRVARTLSLVVRRPGHEANLHVVSKLRLSEGVRSRIQKFPAWPAF